MTDIQSREDIIRLVDSFYDKVRLDETIGYVFNDVMQVNWDHHLGKMYDFWGSILLGEMKYKGTIMAKHHAVHDKEYLHDHHFEAWLKLWRETVTSLYEGPNANEALRRADLMAQLLKFKLRKNIH